MVKYGAQPAETSKTAAGSPGTKDVKRPIDPPKKDKKP